MHILLYLQLYLYTLISIRNSNVTKELKTISCTIRRSMYIRTYFGGSIQTYLRMYVLYMHVRTSVVQLVGILLLFP